MFKKKFFWRVCDVSSCLSFNFGENDAVWLVPLMWPGYLFLNKGPSLLQIANKGLFFLWNVQNSNPLREHSASNNNKNQYQSSIYQSYCENDALCYRLYVVIEAWLLVRKVPVVFEIVNKGFFFFFLISSKFQSIATVFHIFKQTLTVLNPSWRGGGRCDVWCCSTSMSPSRNSTMTFF